jgi:hypothetical protein
MRTKNRVRFAFLLFAALLLSVPASAADSSYTGGALNGRFWAQASAREREVFAMGFFDAVRLMQLDERAPVRAYATDFICNCTVTDISTGISSFYAEPMYRSAPIAFAWRIQVMKARGATPEEIREAVKRAMWMFDLLGEAPK